MPIVWAHSSARPFVIIGGVCIIGGGLLSAIMAGAPSYHASWAVAYIVLIPGVAQFVLGTAQAALTTGAVPRRLVAAEALSWNLGNAGVVAGTLAGIPAVLYVGDALMLVALATVVTVLSGVPHSKSRTAVWFLVALLVAGSVIGIVIQATTG